MKTIPNLLTLARIVMIPFFVLVYYLPFQWNALLAAMIFFLAGFTDWLDGYMARILEQYSTLGAFLDPVADKLLVAIALVLLVANDHFAYIAIPAAIIIGREIVISALREWMAELGKRTSVAVNYVGKVKTLMQMLAIFILLIYLSIPNPMYYWVGYIALYLSAFLTLWSMTMYIKAAWPNFSVEK